MKRTSLRRCTKLRRGSWLRRVGKRARRRRASLVEFRREVLRRACWRCERCGARDELQAHHVLPRARGGGDEPENGRCLCATCHDAVTVHTAEDFRRWLR